ncbi:MAG: hypothetical protein ACI9NQ_001073 [Paracoccaceae bacterium]|jgi:hypothetical protein
MVKKGFFEFVAVCLGLMLLVGQGNAGLSPAATAFRLRLQESEAGEDFQKMEEWVFEDGLKVERVIERFEEAMKVISLTSYSSRYRSERENLSKRLVEEFTDSWEAWLMAAEIHEKLPDEVVLREDGFERRAGWGSGTHNVRKRDRIRVLQLILKAKEVAERGHKSGTVHGDALAEVYLKLADQFERIRTDRSKVLTDLNHLPKPESEYERIEERGAVLDAAGKLLLPELRESFGKAVTDDERIYWLRNRAVEVALEMKAEAKYDLAIFWHDLLGVEQLADEGLIYIEGSESELDMEAPGEFELHTLGADESLVLGPEGPQRVTLPAHCRFISMLQEIVEDKSGAEDYRWRAASALVETIYVDRRQFALALELAEKMGTRKVMRYGKGIEEKIEIWGLRKNVALRSGGSVAHGSAPEVTINSRGLDQVKLELRKVNLEKGNKNFGEGMNRNLLLWSRALRFREEDGDREWMGGWLDEFSVHAAMVDVPIRKKGNWMQTATRVEMPDLTPGHYLILLEDGEDLEILPIQIYDVALLGAEVTWRKDADEDQLLYLVDPTSGEALEGVEFWQAYRPSFYTLSDHQGQLHGVSEVYPAMVRRRGSEWQILQWDRAYGTFSLWGGPQFESFLVTNQPLYRPGQKVSMAGWLRLVPQWMGWERELPVELPLRMRVYDPTGKEVWTGATRLDDFNGFTGEFQLGDEVVLGEYRVELDIQELHEDGSKADVDPFAVEEPVAEDERLDLKEIVWDRDAVSQGFGWNFEVGEFRKPDFQVKLEPVDGSGDFATTVGATYLSGEPMKGAAVVVGFEATPMLARVFPKRTWDDLYEAGYEWGNPKLRHIRGWERWAMWSSYSEVMEGESDDIVPWNHQIRETVELVTGDDGRVKVEFESELPNLDRYSYHVRLVASVTEFSGRSVAAANEFVHTGHSFEVFARPLKGFYRKGEQVEVEVGILTREREPLTGRGVFKVERMVEGKFLPVLSREIEVGEDGLDMVSFAAPSGGQYRCVFKGGGSERGFVLEVIGGEKQVGNYGGVQVLPRDFISNPGETVEVLVRTDEPSTKVWLFEAMPDGMGSNPRVVTTENHTAIIRLPVSRAARPNFGVEAMAFWEGRLRTSLALILVPDETSRLNVEMKLDREVGEPGGKAAVEVEVRDHKSAMAEASLALTIFDRALEDLGGDLPSTMRLKDMFYLESRMSSSMKRDWDGELLVNRLNEPGVFAARYDMSGKTEQTKASRFVKHGDEIWERYEPPELPNQVGSGVGGGGGASFPMTPATPRSFPQAARGGQASLPEAELLGKAKVRKDFSDRAYWGGALRTGKDGRLKVDFELPENLTSWRVQSWAFGRGRSFGEARLELPVSKELQLRPLLPRVAVVGDELVIGAMIQNLSEGAGSFMLTLELEGAEVADQGARKIELEAGAEGVAQWRVTMTKSGAAVFRVKAASADGKLTDGFEQSVPVAAREVSRTVSDTAMIETNEKISELRFAYDPGMAGRKIQIGAEAHAAVSALTVLPDLVQYPYGCAEQTLNRFLPLLVASESASQLGLDWDKMVHLSKNNGHSLGWISGRGQAELSREPVDLSEAKVNDMVHVGISRLREMQNDDGSWGWFSEDDPDARVYLTALAVRGLTMAEKAGKKLKKDHPTQRAVSWLEGLSWTNCSEKSSLVLLAKAAFVAWALKEAGSDEVESLVKKLWKMRDVLPLTSRIHLALAMEDKEKVAVLTEEIRKEIAVLKVDRNRYFSWWNEPVERRACFLKLLVKVGAEEGEIREEIRTLLAARKDGVHWKSTRESGFCLEAIVEAMLSFDLDPFAAGVDTEIEIRSKGKAQTVILSKEELWSGKIELPVAAIVDGGEKEIVLEITRRGNLESAVFLNAAITHPSSDPRAMKSEEGGLKLKRQYFRVNADRNRTLLKEGDVLKVGEMIEVILRIDSDESREFLHLRDPIPAGLEPMMQLSGYHQSAYRESWTGESHFFISELSHWNRNHRYTLSVVTEGVCLALPAHVECLYSPEIRGRSAARRFSIER